MPDRPIRFLAAALGLAAVVLLALSVVPRDAIAAATLLLAGRLNEAFYELLPLFRLRLRVLALVLIVGGTLLWRFAPAVSAWSGDTFPPLWRAVRRGPPPGDPLVRLTLLALVAGGFLLRWHFLFDPVGFDEADSITSYGSRPLLIGLSWYSLPNNHIFHTLWMHFAWQLFGAWEWAIRLPALVAGLILIPVTYAIGKQFYDRPTGLLAAGLVTASPWLVLYSVESRGYTILCVLACLLWLCSRSLLRDDAWPVWCCWALVIGLGFYTIPTFLFVAAGAALWLLLNIWDRPDPARRRFLRRGVTATAISIALTALFYLPVLLVMGLGPLVSNPFVKPRTLSYVIERAPVSFGELIHFWTGDYPGLVTALLAAALLFGLIWRFRGNGYRVPPLLAAVFMGLLLALAQRVVPYTRVWTYLTPLAAITTAAGLAWVLGRVSTSLRLAAALSLLIATGLGYFVWHGSVVPSRSSHPGIENIAVWLRGNIRAGDIVTCERTAIGPLSYYLRRHDYRGEIKLAPCDPVTVFYQDRDATPSGRAFAVIAKNRQTKEKVLSTVCLEARQGSRPIVSYQRPGLSVIEFPYTQQLTYRPAPSSLLE